MSAIILFSVLAALTARWRGYSWKYWVYPIGFIGLIVIACTKSLADIPEDEKAAQIRKVNKIGLILTSIGLTMGFAGVIAAIMLY